MNGQLVHFFCLLKNGRGTPVVVEQKREVTEKNPKVLKTEMVTTVIVR